MPFEPSENDQAFVADDDPDVRELFAECLRDRGFVVASVGDGRAAVAELERSPGRYQIVFTDLSMPGADGISVLRAARAANPAAYIVIVTGYATLDSAIQAVREGANDYLTKPCSLGQIDIAVQRARAHLTVTQSHLLIDRLSLIEQRLQSIERGLAQLETRLIAALPPR